MVSKNEAPGESKIDAKGCAYSNGIKMPSRMRRSWPKKSECYYKKGQLYN